MRKFFTVLTMVFMMAAFQSYASAPREKFEPRDVASELQAKADMDYKLLEMKERKLETLEKMYEKSSEEYKEQILEDINSCKESIKHLKEELVEDLYISEKLIEAGHN